MDFDGAQGPSDSQNLWVGTNKLRDVVGIVSIIVSTNKILGYHSPKIHLNPIESTNSL